MVNLRVAILGVCFALTSVPAFAADELVLLDFDDDLLPEPRVTAEAVFVGLVWPRLNETAVANETILAAIPQAMREQDVCVRVTTEDGRYTGKARYGNAGAATSSMALLPYGPADIGLGGYPDESIAVLAFSCNEAARFTNVAVTSWRSRDDQLLGDTANLLVNSFRADEAFLLVDGAKEIECIALDAGERAAFDFSCPLAIADIKQGPRISLFRVRGASMDPEVAVNVIGWE